MNFEQVVIGIFFVFGCFCTWGQIPAMEQDSLPTAADAMISNSDILDGAVTIKDALSEKVEYGSTDTSFLDAERKELHLIGDAYALYQSVELRAHYIIVKLDSNLAIARGAYDANTGESLGLPAFLQDGREITSDYIRFNFETEKGIIREFRTLEQDIYILGERTKYVSASPEEGVEEDAIYFRNGEFTTCDHEEPHYALKSSKIKTVFNKVAVLGPTNVQISRVPTPVWLPFAFFPLKKQKSSGLIFPRDYEYSEQLGFGLSNVGYYFPINDQVDLTAVGDIYFNGTFAIRPQLRYNRRYKYRGNLQVNYRSQVGEFIRGDSARVSNRIRSYSVRWQHDQDPKAHPTRSFGGSINFQSNNDQRRTFNDAQSVSQNSLNSNVNFNQSFPGKPYSLAASLQHSQNNNTRLVSITFPRLNFRMSRIYPFQRKQKVGAHRWYETISLQYNAEATGRIQAVDTLLFEQETLDDLRYGLRHSAQMETNLKVLKYFTLTPRIDYNESYLSHTQRRSFIDSFFVDVTRDTLSDGQVLTSFDTTFGRVDTMIQSGLSPFRDLSMSVSLNTQIFSTLQFEKGWLRGIRYTVRPNLSLVYNPDQRDRGLDYIRSVQTSNEPGAEDPRMYNKFGGLNNIYSVNPGEESLRLAYSLGGVIAGKTFVKKDSSFRKLNLLKTLNVGGNYNFSADSLHFSPLSMTANTVILKGVSTLRFQAGWSFYATGEEGRVIDKFYMDESGKPLRFTGASLSIRNSLNAQTLRQIFAKDSNDNGVTSGNQRKSRSQRSNNAAEAADLLDLLENLRLEHNMTISWRVLADTSFAEISRNLINLRISRMQLTPNWNLRVGNIGYDFIREQFTYPDFGLFRNLHCWEAGINVQPRRGTFSFFIAVKPSSFSFLRVPYRRNNVDGPLNF